MCPIPKLLQIRVSGAKFTLDYRVRSKLLQNKVSDTNISLDQFARYRNYSWSEFLVQTLLLIIGSDHKTLEQNFRYIYISRSAFPIPKPLVIRVSSANINLDYSVRSKLLLTRVFDTYISLDHCARYRNYSWSEFLVQTLLLIIGIDQNKPDQSLRYTYFSWLVCPIPKSLLIRVSAANISLDYRDPIKITPDQSLRYKYFSWSLCPIMKIPLIRVSGANITFDYRVRSYLLLTTVFDTKTSLDQFARYRNYFWSEFLVQTLLLIKGSNQNYSWPESPINIFLLISVPDTEITLDQSFWCKHYSWL